MKKRLNKIPTNYTVALTPQEVTNLSETLSAVRTAGGGTGGVYIGDGQYIGVDNTNNKISFLPDAATKLESVSNKLDESTYAADSATFLTAHQSLSGYYQKTETSSKEQLSTEFEKYQTVAGMAEYLTTSNAQTTYLTKSSAEENLAPISVTADVEVLKANSGDFSQYYKKTDTSSKEELSAEFDKYQTKADMESYATDQDVVNLQLNLENLISSKQPKLTFGYNENNAISSINDSALAGQGGTTYSAGAGIAIVDEYISLSADYIQAITQVSGKQDKLEFTYDTSGSIIKINNSAIAGGAGGGSVSYTGRNGVEINGNYIELETSAKNAIDSVAGISTDVGTLKTASGDWNDVSAKLNTTDFNTYTATTAPSTYQAKGDYVKNTDIGLNSNNKVTAISGKELIITAHQSLTNYYTKSETSGATELSTEFGKYALKSEIPTVPTKVSDLTDSANYYKTTETSSKNELSTEFAKYLTTAQYNTDSATFALKSDLNGLVNSASVTTNDNYVMTNTGWKVLTLPGGGMTQVYHDNTLTGDGNANDNQLGVKWETLSSNTIDYSNSAFNLTNGTSVSSFDQISAAIDDRYSKSSSDGRYLQKSLDDTLTGNGTNNKKLGVAWSALSGNTINSAKSAGSAEGLTNGTAYSGFDDISAAFGNLSAYLPTSGGIVSGQLVVSGGSTFDSENLKFIRTGQNGYGRIGLASDGALALKVDNGAGDTLQINMSTEGSTGYGNINVNNHSNQSKVVNVPTASYNSMSSFDNTNGPNYMLRKTASGFDIGAAVINVTQLPQNTEANAYYFVYDV